MISRVHIIHHSHTDAGYTDEPERVVAQQVGHLEKALALMEETRSRPPEGRFCWTVESSWVAREYCRRHGLRGKRRLAEAAQAGQLEVSAFAWQPITHLQCPLELRRNFAWAVEFGREAGVPCRVAILNDIGSATWPLADAMAEQGVGMLVLGLGGYRILTPWSKLPPIFWWVGPRGGKVLFYTYHHVVPQPGPEQRGLPPAPYGFGKLGFLWPARVARKAAGEAVLPSLADAFLGKLSWTEVEAERLLGQMEADRYPCPVAMFQAASDNAGPDGNLPGDVAWLNAHLHGRRVTHGSARVFLDEIVARHAAAIPTLSGDLHCSWSDQAGCLARATRQYREASRLDRATARLLRGRTGPRRLQAAIEENLDGLLVYSDHTFGLTSWGFGEMKPDSFGPGDPLAAFHERTWDSKAAAAAATWRSAWQIHFEAQEKFVAKLPDGASAAFLNTLDRATAAFVGSQVVVAPSRPVAWIAGRRRLPLQTEPIRPKWWRIWVPVPAMKARQLWGGQLELEGEGRDAGEVAGQTHAAGERQESLNPRDGLKLGGRSLRFDEATGRCLGWRGSDGRERLDPSVEHGLGEFLHAEVDGIPDDPRGAGIGWPIERKFSRRESSAWSPGTEGDFTACRRANHRLLSRSGLQLLTSTEWRLFSGMDELEITVAVDKPRCVGREDARVVFPLTGSCREVLWSLAGATARWKDLLPGSHTGWLTIQNWVAVQTGEGWLALMSFDAPLVEVGGIGAETWRGCEGPPAKPWLSSYVFNNFYQTNTAQWQGGNCSWRYRLRWFPSSTTAEEIHAWSEERDLGIVGIRRGAGCP
jgi:hypothetical protein